MSERMDEYLLRLEKNLMTGSARWIADFTESFRDYEIEGTRFDMVLTGGMRVRSGFLMSRLFSYLTLPDYQVACFVRCSEPETTTFRRLIKLISDYMEAKGMKWSWLVVPVEDPFSYKLERMVEKLDLREIGVALVNIASEEVLTDSSYVGRRLKSQVRCFQ